MPIILFSGFFLLIFFELIHTCTLIDLIKNLLLQTQGTIWTKLLYSLYCWPYASVDSATSKVYDANPDLYNTKSTNEPLSFKQTDSLQLCSMPCVNEYNCFNFNIQTGTCLLYNSCNSSDMTVSESGWRFFTDISLKQEGKYMLDHYLFIIFQYQTENKKCIIIY